MTYKQLADLIYALKPEQQNQDVTIHDQGEDEIYPLGDVMVTTTEEDRLDPGHPILTIN